VLFHFYRGYTGAGGLEKNGLYRNCTGGAARLVDVSLFGNDHIYQRPTPRAIYDTTLAFDPEGLCFFHSLHFCAYLDISSNDEESLFLNFFFIFYIFFQFSGALGGLTCVLCAYLGAEAAKVLLVFPANKQRIVRWMLWALVTVSSKIEY
jgi:heparan-alpha-glucosaminide N-acetyltransferase